MRETAPDIPEIPGVELIRIIGEGSFGELWLGKTVEGAFTAVKVVYRSRFKDDRPFQRELKGFRRFEPVSGGHDGLVQIDQFGEDLDHGYFHYSMELADDATGGAWESEESRPLTLLDYLSDQGPMDERGCLELALHLAKALGYLHSEGLVHRDVKPSNIVRIGEQWKLADIGLMST